MEMNEASCCIKISGLRKTFKGHLSLSKHQVLRGVNLTVPQGGIYGFLGPNGAGKTTTLKILTGLLFPDGGRVSILGKPLGSFQVRERIGFLPESPYFHDYLSGRELLLFMGRLFGLKGKTLHSRAEMLLETVGLKEKGKVQLRKYSKGMLQRMGVAQALINDPELVIMDEPMTGLDPIGRRDMRDLILGLKKKGKTVLFSSHILGDAESICDRVAILVNGLVAKEGALEELLDSEVGSWDVTLKAKGDVALPEGSVILARRGSKILLRIGSEKVLNDFLAGAVGKEAVIEGIVPHKASLEDLFMAQMPVDGGER